MTHPEPLCFEIGDNQEKAAIVSSDFADLLEKHVTTETELSCYDTFDWLLFHRSMTLLHESGDSPSATLLQIEKHSTLVTAPWSEIPAFPKTGDALGKALRKIQEIRALLYRGGARLSTMQYDLRNKDKKIIARIRNEEWKNAKNERESKHLIVVESLKGFASEFETLISRLEAKHGKAKPYRQFDILVSLCKLTPGDYSSKPVYSIYPSMRAVDGARSIFSTLLKMIRQNEEGVRNDLDTEFLHDLRVAIRRTRTGLSQFKHVFEDEFTSRYRTILRELQQLTNESRDLDVYLLQLDRYRKMLPGMMRNSLEPFQTFLSERRKESLENLRQTLQGETYSSKINEWTGFLLEPLPEALLGANGRMSIKELADWRIKATFERIVKKGCKIDTNSPPEMLHSLRIDCKNMRYLLEFFANFYSEERVKPLIEKLKDLQDILGEYQDMQIQSGAIRAFATTMDSGGAPTETLLALGALVAVLLKRMQKARGKFQKRFDAFAEQKIRQVFQE